MNKRLMFLAFFVSISFLTSQNGVKTYQVGQILTPKGEMLFWLFDETPVHQASFIKLANANYWDSLTFNRVIMDLLYYDGHPKKS